MNPPVDARPTTPVLGTRRTLWITLAAMITLSALALTADRWWAGGLRAEASEAVATRLAGHASALELAFAKQSVLLESLAAWIADERRREPESFEEFAEALQATAPGVRALQAVEGGRIFRSYPAEGNEGVVGFDLAGHPDPRVPEGLLRTLDRGGVTLTGPVELIQGGVGVILRRSTGQAGDRSAPSAALVVDVASLMEEAGLSAVGGSLRIGLETDDGTPFFGETLPDADNPVSVRIPLPEGSWRLVAAPVGGWSAEVAGSLLSVRLALLLLLALGTVVAYLLVDRDTRLALAVAHRTEELSESNRQLAATAAKLATQGEQLGAALEAGRVLTWSWDVPANRVTRSSSEFSLTGGVTALPETAEGFIDVVHPEDRPAVAQALDAARRTGTLGHEYRLQVAAGSYIWVRAEGRAVESDARGPIRIVGATADISRVKELESQLIHRGRLELIGRLAGGIAHDFNNILTVIRAELELGLEEESDHTLTEAAHEALDAAQHASVLTGQLLIFAHRDVAQPATFEWDTLCGETMSFVRRLLGGLVELEVHLAAPGARVRMDPAQAKQILTNLAVNAKDAMPDGGQVAISTKVVADGSSLLPEARRGPALLLEVRDTGTGIADEVQPLVFEPFYTTKGLGGGTGLGLSTSQSIARQNGGDMGFMTSEQGTTLSVVIPLARDDGEHPPG